MLLMMMKTLTANSTLWIKENSTLFLYVHFLFFLYIQKERKDENY